MLANKPVQTYQKTFFFAVSALLMSQALHISFGVLDVNALALLTLSFLWCLAGFANVSLERKDEVIKVALYRILGIGFLIQSFQLLTQQLEWEIKFSQRDYAIYLIAIGVAATLALFRFSPHQFLQKIRFSKWGFPTLLCAHFFIGVWIIRHVPDPGIDVYVIQRDSAQALLNGKNPYTMTYPDVYGNTKSFLYGQGLAAGGRLLFGYVYPPLSAILAIPGLLFGDVRYSNLFAITAGGALLGYARRTRLSFLAATLFLLLPQSTLIVMRSWTDAYVVFFFCLLCFTACRYPKLNFLPFGLLLAAKQYLFLGAPLAFLLVDARSFSKQEKKVRYEELWRLYGGAFLVVMVVTLPFVLWNARAFIDNALLLNFQQPFRADSLNYTGLYSTLTGNIPSSLIGFLLLIPAYFWVMKRSPATPAGYASATAAIYFVFFLFGRQAFINYYFFIFAALCAAVALFEEENFNARDENQMA